MKNYSPYWLPSMTVEQALHISTQPYEAYPEAVTSQATSILAVEQAHQLRRVQEKIKELNGEVVK